MSSVTYPAPEAGRARAEAPQAPMSSVPRPVIIVGVSGSPSSARALRWAATEAARVDGQLKIVLVWRAEPRAFYAPATSTEEYQRREQRAVMGLTAMVRAEIGPARLGDAVTEVVHGVPERELIERSGSADLLVLGSGSAAITGRSIGAVIRACLSNARCPVVIVGPQGPNSGGSRRIVDPRREPDTGQVRREFQQVGR